MRYPTFLQPNGTIGFIAPSFGCNTEPYYTAFQNALKNFKNMGYKTILGPNVYAGEGIGKSNTPELCAREMNDFFTKEDVDILISCGGGELMCEDLNYVDFQTIKEAQPKWFMGYSDNTNMTFLLNTICDVAAIYGPCAATFGMEPWHDSLHDAFSVLTGKKLTVKGYDLWEKESLKDAEHPLEPYHVTETRILHHFPKENAKMEGRLLGGCVDCLSNLVGTQFDHVKEFNTKYGEDGIIWFLESCDLDMISLRRAFWQLDSAGWFEKTKGFLIGRPLHYGENDFGLDQYEAVLGILRKYHVPVIMDLDIGHLAPMMPLISGAMAEVTVSGNDISIEMELK